MNRGQAKIILVVVIAILAIVIGYSVATYNRLVALHENIPAQWAQVENVMQRRNDLIPNLVATVKGYAKHEEKVFGDVDAALKSFGRAQTVPQKLAADDQITGLLSRLLAVSVQYPNLKADQNFLQLQDELEGTENRIAVERRRYNEMVREYNTKVQTFPTSLIARWAGFTPSANYFQAAPEAQKAPVVQF